MNGKIKSMLLMGVLLVSPSSVLAVNEVPMLFRGVLVEPPVCTINDGNQIDVNFGDRIGVGEVDGVKFRQKINYWITCDKNPGSGWNLFLSLNGTKSAFDANALQTNKQNLGVRIYQGGKVFTPGTSVGIYQVNPPALEAVPVKQPGTKLTEGSFQARATLRAEYQ